MRLRGAQLALVLLLLGVGVRACQDLPVIVAGCAVLSAGPRCELPDDVKRRQIHLFVPGAQEARLLVLADGRPIHPSDSALVADGVRLLVDVPPRTKTLRVLSRRGVRVGHHRLSIGAIRFSSWLRDARQAWESNHAAAAAAVLSERLTGTLSPADRAEALGILGRIRREEQRIDEAEALLRQALAADREAGLISNEGNDTLALAALLVQDRRQLRAAQALLDDQAPLFARAASLRPWVLRHQGTYLKMQGDLDGALAKMEQGRRAAQQIGDRQAMVSLHLGIATLLQMLGNLHTAGDELTSLAAETKRDAPCVSAGVLESQGMLRILERQSQSMLGAAAANPPDALSPLRAALALRQASCTQKRPIASTLTSLAEATLQGGDAAGALALVAQAEEALREPTGPMSARWSELRGRIALAQGQPAVAARHFGGLLPGAQGEGADDLRWEAHVGLGLAAQGQGDLAAAERHFQAAEIFLDRRRLELSIGEGRIGYLGRHERGTAAYLALLLDMGRLPEALGVLRHARARGLRDLFRLSRLGELDDEGRARWEAALGAYRESRARLERLAAEAYVAPRDEEQVLLHEQRQVELQLRQHLDRALLVLQEPPTTAPRALDEGEVLLACHPLGQGWLCLIARGAEVRSLRLDHAPTQADAGRILAGGGSLLEGATRLTVLPYGRAMEEIDFARERLAGTALGERVVLVHSLDIAPRIDLSAGPPGGVVLLVDPAQDLAKSQLPDLGALIGPGGWRVLDAGRGVAPGRLAGALEQGELLYYYGHATSSPYVLRRSLLTAGRDRVGMTVTDILTLRRVPRQVVLIGCQTSATSEDGGAAGLGLAQAFLLRGATWAIATTRSVNVSTGLLVANRLLRGGASALVEHPAAALWGARQAALPEESSAFRLLVP